MSKHLVTSVFEGLVNHRELLPDGKRITQVLGLLGIEYGENQAFKSAINLVIETLAGFQPVLPEPAPSETASQAV